MGRTEMDDEIRSKAKKLARGYVENYTFVSDMEKIRPSIISRIGVDTDGWLPAGYRLPDMKMLPKDRRLAEEYIQRRREKEIVDIAVDGRLSGKCREVVSDSFRCRMKGDKIMEKYGICRNTVTNMRKKGLKAVAEEMILQG